VLFQEIGYTKKRISFSTLSGLLHVDRQDKGYQMDFPADPGTSIAIIPAFEAAIGASVKAAIAGKDDLLLLVDKEAAVAQLLPHQAKIAELGYRGLIVSAPGEQVDFVSRCFYPNYGIAEDPVTGSAHTLMTPYWANQLGKTRLNARQISQRKGILEVEYQGERVLLMGQAVTYLRGEIFV
jgi:predicted PhzF superfamily epimerase YddE/YHI9